MTRETVLKNETLVPFLPCKREVEKERKIDKLREGEINSYQWVSTKKIWADGLTKEMPMTDGIRNLLKNGKCDMVQEDTNIVICQDDEIKMIIIRNTKRGKSEKDDNTTPTTTS